MLRNLHEFTQAISATLEVELSAFGAALVDAVRKVVPADIVVLTVLDEEGGTTAGDHGRRPILALGGEVRGADKDAGRPCHPRP